MQWFGNLIIPTCLVIIFNIFLFFKNPAKEFFFDWIFYLSPENVSLNLWGAEIFAVIQATLPNGDTFSVFCDFSQLAQCFWLPRFCFVRVNTCNKDVKKVGIQSHEISSKHKVTTALFLNLSTLVCRQGNTFMLWYIRQILSQILKVLWVIEILDFTLWQWYTISRLHESKASHLPSNISFLGRSGLASSLP